MKRGAFVNLNSNLVLNIWYLFWMLKNLGSFNENYTTLMALSYYDFFSRFRVGTKNYKRAILLPAALSSQVKVTSCAQVYWCIKTIRLLLLLLHLYYTLCDNEVIEWSSERARIVKSSATLGNGWAALIFRLRSPWLIWFFYALRCLCFFQLWKIYKWGVCLQIKGDRAPRSLDDL
jgi:hypothetical protein